MFSNMNIRETGPIPMPGGHMISEEELIGVDIKFEMMDGHRSKFGEVSKYIKDAKPEHYYAWRVYDRNQRGGIKEDAKRADTLWNEMGNGKCRPVLMSELKDDHDLPCYAHPIHERDSHGTESTVEAVTYRGMMLVELTDRSYVNDYLWKLKRTADQTKGLHNGEAFKGHARQHGFKDNEVDLYFGSSDGEQGKLNKI